MVVEDIFVFHCVPARSISAFIVNSSSLQLLVHQFLGAKNVPKKPLVMPWMNQYLPFHWTQFAHMKYLLDFQCDPARSVLLFY